MDGSTRRPDLATLPLTGDEITIFDSTGVAVEDAASAAQAYELAAERRIGRGLAFAPAEAAA